MNAKYDVNKPDTWPDWYLKLIYHGVKEGKASQKLTNIVMGEISRRCRDASINLWEHIK